MSDNAFSDEYSEEFRRHEELDFLDRAALAAMSGIYAGDVNNLKSPKKAVEIAWETADLMLAERTKRRANRGA